MHKRLKRLKLVSIYIFSISKTLLSRASILVNMNHSLVNVKYKLGFTSLIVQTAIQLESCCFSGQMSTQPIGQCVLVVKELNFSILGDMAFTKSFVYSIKLLLRKIKLSIHFLHIKPSLSNTVGFAQNGFTDTYWQIQATSRRLLDNNNNKLNQDNSEIKPVYYI